MLSRLTELGAAWVVFPLVLAALCLGLSRLVHWATRTSTHILLDLPLGFAALVVVGQLATGFEASARFTVWIVLVAAAVGLVLSPIDWREWFSVSRRPLAFAAVTYLIYLSPVIMSAKATFVGWIKLDDASTFIAFADQLLTAGRTTAGLPQSTFEAALQYNFDRGYPMGAFVPFGVVAQILHIDMAWIYQPYIAFLAAMITLTFIVVLRRFVNSPLQRGIFAVGATCSSLLVGYAWWGGVKELTLVPLLAMVAHFVDEYRPGGDGNRALLPLAVVMGAFIAVFAPTGAAWLAVPLVYLVWKYQRAAPDRTMGDLVLLLGATAVLASATLKAFGGLDAYKTALTFAQGDPDIGNLAGPLNPLQIAGVWPAGDFRNVPVQPAVAEVMIAFVLVLAALAVARMMRTDHRGLAIVAVSTTALALATTRGNAWIAGKSLAVASPFVLLCAMVGLAILFQESRQLEYFASSSIVGAGIVWSLALGYNAVWVAPYDQLRELELIGTHFTEAQPALIIEYSPYGARHFLRNMAAEGAGELRRRPVTMANGSELAKGAYADVDEFALDTLQTYETLVLRRSPYASRPPVNFALQASDANFEVWQKDGTLPIPVEHVAFGSQSDPGATPSCDEISAIASRATNGSRLVAALAPAIIPVSLAGASLPAGWVASGDGVIPQGAGTVTVEVSVAAAGDYELWVQGWSRGRTTISVDGKQVGTMTQVLNQTRANTAVGSLALAPGTHQVTVDFSAPWWMPGVGGASDPLGPIALTPKPGTHTVVQVEAADFASLCGKRLDWVEIAH